MPSRLDTPDNEACFTTEGASIYYTAKVLIVSNVDDVLDIIRTASTSSQATVSAFAGLSRKEREHLAKQLNAIASTLMSPFHWVPTLCDQPFMILLEHRNQAIPLQEALFRLGCGYHNGDYENLSRELTDVAELSVSQVLRT